MAVKVTWRQALAWRMRRHLLDPIGTLPVARWDGLPSVTSNYDGGRSAIRANVERLVDSLLKATSRPKR